jgi:hypothetical protein
LSNQGDGLIRKHGNDDGAAWMSNYLSLVYKFALLDGVDTYVKHFSLKSGPAVDDVR